MDATRKFLAHLALPNYATGTVRPYAHSPRRVREAVGSGVRYAGDVVLTVQLSDELAQKVEELAAARHQSPEQVVIEAIESQVAPRRHLSFSGVGSSGTAGQDIARRHREIIGHAFGLKTARDV